MEIATKYDRTPAQIILAWHIANERAVAVRSRDEDRLKSNLNIDGISLDQTNMSRLSELDREDQGTLGSGPTFGGKRY